MADFFARLLIFSIALFWPAGTWQWWEAWVVIFLWTCFALAMMVYLSRHERGHEVITMGPYAIVRHPMYTVAIVIILSLSVALGSRYGLIPAAILTLILIVRTHFEDRTLHKELAGYPEYAKQTPYRLIPGIW